MEVSMKKKKKEKIVNVAWQEMPGKNEARNGDALLKLGCLCKEEKIMHGQEFSKPNRQRGEYKTGFQFL